MTESFQAITIEVKSYTGTGTYADWVDVSADRLYHPFPRGSRGILTNDPLVRLASPGQFTFSLDNSEANSQATLGYYSLNSTGGRIDPGFLVRVGFKYEGRTRYKWAGWVDIDGIRVVPGTKGPRRVDITAIDFFSLCDRFPLDLLTYTISKKINEAVALVVAELPAEIQPTYTRYATGNVTFPDVFDIMRGETRASAEFNKLVMSELGYIYSIGNEQDGLTLCVDNRDKTYSATSIRKTDSETTSLFLLANGTDRLLLANGTDKLLLTETQTISFGDADMLTTRPPTMSFVYHSGVKARVYGRRTDADATTVLWTMETPVEVAASSTVTEIRGRYRDPNSGTSYVNCIAGTAPVANTDFKAFANRDGTGTDLTANCVVTAEFGAAEVEVTIQNTGGTTFYVGGREGGAKFQVRGQGRYVYDSTDIAHGFGVVGYWGEHIAFVDMVYHSDPVEARTYLISKLYTPFKGVLKVFDTFPLYANRDKKNMMAFMYLEPFTVATFAETLIDINAAKRINGYEFEIIGDDVYWSPVPSANSF